MWYIHFSYTCAPYFGRRFDYDYTCGGFIIGYDDIWSLIEHHGMES